VLKCTLYKYHVSWIDLVLMGFCDGGDEPSGLIIARNLLNYMERL
jgi:hypothetical protein